MASLVVRLGQSFYSPSHGSVLEGGWKWSSNGQLHMNLISVLLVIPGRFSSVLRFPTITLFFSKLAHIFIMTQEVDDQVTDTEYIISLYP